MGMTQAQKDKSDARIKGCASYAAYDAKRTAWEAEVDPATKRTLAIERNQLAMACGQEVGAF